MRVLSFNVYPFNELSEEAQKKAWNDWLNCMDYVWIDEGIKSIHKFADAFGVKITNYEVTTYGRSYITTNVTNDAFRGIDFKKAVELIADNTDGYCVYETMKDRFIDSVKGNGDMKGAFIDAIEAGLKDVKNDMEYQESFEYFKDMAQVNDYEFYFNGKMI